MKPYLPKNRVPLLGMFTLVFGSILLGLLTGALAYFVSQFVYFIVLFPLGMAGVATVGYFKLVQFSKVRHSAITALMGFVTGLIVMYTFYGVPYLVFRQRLVVEIQHYYQVDTRTAASGFNNILRDETGSGGLLGFMKLRAREGDEYTHYLMFNAVPIQEFHFKLVSTGAWLYWAFECILIPVALAGLGYSIGGRFFNQSVNDWYDPIPSLIGVVTLDRKEELLTLAQAHNLQGIRALMVPEGELPHPVLEIDEQHSKNQQGDILLIFKQSFRDGRGRIKRIVLERWEISQREYLFLKSMQAIEDVGVNLEEPFQGCDDVIRTP